MNKSKLVFETTAELMAFIKKRKIYHGTMDRTEITLTALLTRKDIEVACKDFNARVLHMPDNL